MKKRILTKLFITLIIIFSVNLSLFGQSFTKVYDSRIDTTIKAYTRPQPIDVGDIDKNGLMDLLICGETETGPSSDIYFQVSEFVFERNTTELLGVYLGRNLFTDLNSDNNLDVFLSGIHISGSYNGYPACNYLMNGDSIIGEYIKTGAWNSGNWQGDAGSSDLNNDGYMDAVTIGWSSWGGASWSQTGAAFQYNPVDGFSWKLPPAYPAEGSLGLMDFDQDGYVDYFVSGRYMNSAMTPFTHIYYSDGTAYNGVELYDLHDEYNQYSMYPNAKINDFNADGMPDILGSNRSEGSFFLFNNGDKSFTKQLLPGSIYDIGDYDNDGDLDIISAYNVVQRNMGNFNQVEQVYEDFEFLNIKQAKFADIDKDGDLDIFEIGSDSEGNMVTIIYRNDIMLANQAPLPPKKLSTTSSFETINLNWDRGSDFETNDLSLSYNYYCRSMVDTLGSPMADIPGGTRLVEKHGNAAFDTLAILKKLTYGTYHWAVQSIDVNYVGSAFSEEEVFIIRDFELSDKKLCAGEQTRINYFANFDSKNSYTWDFSDPDTILGGGLGPYVLRWDNPGEKLVKFQVSDSSGRLIYETSDTIIVLARPTSPFELTEEVALNEMAHISYKGNTSFGTFNWDFNSASQNPEGVGPHEISWNSLGEKTVSLEVVNAAGCSSPITSHSVQVQLKCSFERKDTICQSEETQYYFSGIGGPQTMYNWNFPDASFVEGSGAGPYQVRWDEAGTKVVSLQLADGIYNSEVFTDTVFVEALPVFSIDGDDLICDESELVLNINGTTPDQWSYEWSTGATTQEMSLSPDRDTSVSVIAFTNRGCAGYDTMDIHVTKPRDDGELCIVTVSNAGKNMLIWEKPDIEALTRYRIYKESATAGFFTILGEQEADQLSVYVDENSSPGIRSDKYKIAIVDTCGNESPMSPFHKTIHLAVAEAVPSGYNLSWDHIEIENQKGEYGTYYIYRGDSYASLELIEEIPSSLNQYTDPEPPAGEVYYQISAKKLDACSPTGLKKGTMEDYTQSFSNVENVDATGYVLNNAGSGIKVYPNPSTGKIILEGLSKSESNIKVFNLQGQLLIHLQTAHLSNLEIDLSNLEQGVYNVVIQSDSELTTKRLILME